MTTEDFKTIITGYGFTFRGKCQCTGHYTEKYKKDNILLYIRSHKGQASYKKHGITAQGYKSLNETLKAIEFEFKDELV